MSCFFPLCVWKFEPVVCLSSTFHLGDNLHYNAKGASLLSKVYEKTIKDFYGIKFDEKIEVEHKEVLPDGVVGQITATANADFWNIYKENVFLFDSSKCENPLFSTRIEITKNENGKYYVTKVIKSGESVSSYGGNYVLSWGPHSLMCPEMPFPWRGRCEH